MLDAYEEAKLVERKEIAYWVSLLMNIHLSKNVSVDQLVKPFLPKKSKVKQQKEREEFFKQFNLDLHNRAEGGE